MEKFLQSILTYLEFTALGTQSDQVTGKQVLWLTFSDTRNQKEQL